MSKKVRTAVTPTREENFPEWYQQVIKAADMAENSPVRGCMTIKPYGFALWENMQRIFDGWLKDYGVQNTSFPLLIPLEYISREADHVEGFATECAVVTHHRLEKNEDGSALVPAGKLEEPYVIRPTSETIIGEAMSRWIRSYRDLPMKLNQWGNVMRWEMRTRMFLRTSEFFWHEGHNAFANEEEAVADTTHILNLYDKFFKEYLAFPGIKGVKTPDERFPGADETYCIEAMMQDGKALQAATSHYLGQNFSKTFNIKYQNKESGEDFVHTTSWAFSSRMVGGLIMMHADDDGMMMPPRIAPTQVMILPILRDDADTDKIMAHAEATAQILREKGLRVQIDSRDMRTPDKMWDAVKKGIPLRVEIGAREADEGTLTHVRRDLGRDSKTTESLSDFGAHVQGILDAIHDDMYQRAKDFMDARIVDIDDAKALDKLFKKKHDGFARMDVAQLEEIGVQKAMEAHKLTSRCLPLADEGKKVLIGKAY
ncbi:MAG: proline--tRNA ligase [Alphaproteobacteria bacterium]|nr:proline--tRNA ligase [Alphaproteobacteria bacterium]HCQ71703.1 proline--tRNA ligase [Rhodospirillaceae bacterium]